MRNPITLAEWKAAYEAMVWRQVAEASRLVLEYKGDAVPGGVIRAVARMHDASSRNDFDVMLDSAAFLICVLSVS